MNGDRTDIVQRLKAVLPSRWFGDATPVLDTLLLALAVGWEHCFQLLQFTRTQVRLATATGTWLDLIAHDFFGEALRRVDGQSDEVFRATIKRNILRPLATRRAVTRALTDLTGRPPRIFEPRNTSDTGGYGTYAANGHIIGGGLGYCAGGGWGNLSMPFQFFVTALRPHGNGVANVSGWGFYGGGYGLGALEYADAAIVSGHLGDSEIMNEVARIAPIGVVAWTNIAN
jgi:hypothetical protein